MFIRHLSSLIAAAAAAFLTPAVTANAADLQEPKVFASSRGVLDLLMVARPNTKPILGLAAPVGWVYEICNRPSPTATSCPSGSFKSDSYGGTRLALKKGDKLKIRLVNALPQVPEAKHIAENADLLLNPTNLHTHGLIVEPRKPTAARPTWGDNIWVLGYNPANGTPQPVVTGSHDHGAVTERPIEYEIDIPANHPSGSFWFHPHVHGIALNQVTAGLAGIITIGDVADYSCEDTLCLKRWNAANTRHMILKDIEIQSTGQMLTQQDPQFCAFQPAAGETRKGSCPGQVVPDGEDRTGGRWIHSINGQVYPTINVTSAAGEIWRLTNASASVSYDLHLWNEAQARDMVFQIVSVDGVSFTGSTALTADLMKQIGASKIRFTPCPTIGITVNSAALPVCASSIRMMPSSRIEVRVAYRDTLGRIVNPPASAKAVFKTVGFDALGDKWPAIDLAEVNFVPGPKSRALVTSHLTIAPQARNANLTGGIFATPAVLGGPSVKPTNCKPALAAGHRRRIYYGVPAGTEDGFGLGYEEIDANGAPVPDTFVDVSEFDPVNAIVCLPLALGNRPVKETWELVNVSGEDHNFHIHQTKFRIVSPTAAQSSPLFAALASQLASKLPFPVGTVLHDNMPLPAVLDESCDGTVATFKSGACTAKPQAVEIEFSQAGDFVYHCHILEHEDGGMMAKISVVQNK